MSPREKFADERRGAETYNEECGVIARWLHDGRLKFSDEADARVAAARDEGYADGMKMHVGILKTERAVAERKGMERAQSEPALISALVAEFRAGMEMALGLISALHGSDGPEGEWANGWKSGLSAAHTAIRADLEDDDA